MRQGRDGAATGNRAARRLEGPRILHDATTRLLSCNLMLLQSVRGLHEFMSDKRWHVELSPFESDDVVLNCLRSSRMMAEILEITLRVREAAFVVIYVIIVLGCS